eukprot:760937-Hanusia_phi.AAC.2
MWYVPESPPPNHHHLSYSSPCHPLSSSSSSSSYYYYYYYYSLSPFLSPLLSHFLPPNLPRSSLYLTLLCLPSSDEFWISLRLLRWIATSRCTAPHPLPSLLLLPTPPSIPPANPASRHTRSSLGVRVGSAAAKRARLLPLLSSVPSVRSYPRLHSSSPILPSALLLITLSSTSCLRWHPTLLSVSNPPFPCSSHAAQRSTLASLESLPSFDADTPMDSVRGGTGQEEAEEDGMRGGRQEGQRMGREGKWGQRDDVG